MADTPNAPAPTPPEEPADGGGVALRAQMAAGEFFLRNGWTIAGITGAALLAILVYGLWEGQRVEAQRATTARIADVEAELGSDLVQIAQAKALGIEGLFDEAKTRKAAEELVAVAREASGTAAAEAWLKAAELFRVLGDAAGRRTALEGAAAGTTGVLRYAAVSGLAHLDVEEGLTDEGIARFESLRTEADFLARQATLDLAGTYEALGRTAEAVATYEAYLARWPEASDAEEVRSRKEKVAGAEG